MIKQPFPKAYTEDEIKELIIKQVDLAITGICQEIGKAMEMLQGRILDLETASNAMIQEMKEWKAKNQRTLQ